jgi:hypothetical protein
MNRMDHICDDSVKDFRILGYFQIDLTIGDHIFEDRLRIARSNGVFGGAIIEGVYSVPNSFESKIQKLNYTDGVFSFQIRVQEGEDDYMAIFEGTLDERDQIKGSAFVLPERTLLGVFTGRREW